MSLGAERRAIEELWLAKWVRDQSATPLTLTQFENVPFEVGKEPNAKKGDCWVRFSVRHGEATQKSLGSPGSNTFRQTSVVLVQLFVPAGTGKAKLYSLADTACDIFRAVAIDNLLFRAPYMTELEPETVWMRALVTAPFYRDENH